MGESHRCSVGCRGGGCRVCKVQVLRGDIVKRAMSRAHVSEEEEADGTVLACRIHPSTDLELAVVGKMRKRVVRASE